MQHIVITNRMHTARPVDINSTARGVSSAYQVSSLWPKTFEHIVALSCAPQYDIRRIVHCSQCQNDVAHRCIIFVTPFTARNVKIWCCALLNNIRRTVHCSHCQNMMLLTVEQYSLARSIGRIVVHCHVRTNDHVSLSWCQQAPLLQNVRSVKTPPQRISTMHDDCQNVAARTLSSRRIKMCALLRARTTPRHWGGWCKCKMVHCVLAHTHTSVVYTAKQNKCTTNVKIEVAKFNLLHLITLCALCTNSGSARVCSRMHLK